MLPPEVIVALALGIPTLLLSALSWWEARHARCRVEGKGPL